MSLYKIPLLISNAWGLYVPFAPPNPPSPEQNEKGEKPIKLETTLPRYVPAALKVAATIPQLLEIWAIIAYRVPGLSGLLGVEPWFTNYHDLHTNLTFVIASLAVFAGTLIRLAAYRHLGSHQFVTSGLYSIVRHPGYAGAILTVIGTNVCLFGRGSWLKECTGLGGLWSIFEWTWVIFTMLPVLILANRTVTREDDLLREAFGKEWKDWAEKVPYKFVPGII